MRIVKFILTCLLLILACNVDATVAIFYQPQARDTLIPSERWPQIFQTVKSQGINTLVIQWSQYGQFLSQDADKEWLKRILIQAKDNGLKLIIGLDADESIFSKMKQSPTELTAYFQKARKNDHNILSYWNQSLIRYDITGWYLPLEIDDREWRDPSARKVLNRHLIEQVKLIQHFSEKPIYISSFFTGNMTPKNYFHMLQELKDDTGLFIWIQDGSGTNKLNNFERSLYLREVIDCNNKTANGLVFELFEQSNHDAQFEAKLLPLKLLKEKLRQKAPCNQDSVFFELRYLINLNSMLK